MDISGTATDDVLMTNRNWPAVRSAIRQRRLELGLLQREACARAGLSMATWTQLEHGPKEAFADRTLAAVERALEWLPGSIVRIHEGGRPQTEADALEGLVWVYEDEDREFQVEGIRGEVARAKREYDRALRLARHYDVDVGDILGEPKAVSPDQLLAANTEDGPISPERSAELLEMIRKLLEMIRKLLK